jgi:arylsulfatase A-like enzyme
MIRVLASLLVATFLLAGAAPAAEVAPNILLIVSEDNGPELGTYRDPYLETPVLDRLAGEGTRFDRAYVPQAGCSQSRVPTAIATRSGAGSGAMSSLPRSSTITERIRENG